MSLQLKIMQYNILDGFHTRESNKLEEHRLKSAVKVVRSERPDILVLIETCDDEHTHHGVKVDYANEFGFQYHFSGHKPNGSRHGITILSEWPFTGVNYSMVDQKLLRACFNLKRKFRLDALHPNPKLDEEQRTQFFKNSLRDMKAPYFAIGDLNSWSAKDGPFDRDKIIARFREFPQFEGNPELAGKTVDSLLKCEAIKEIERHGLIDTYRAVHPNGKAYTIPTDLLAGNKDAAGRLDYIFCSPKIRILEARIIRNRLTELASDHYPITATVEIP